MRLRRGLGILVALIAASAFAAERPRVVVLTDMGADPDDEQSLVRLLLYTNEIDVEGLVATTSCWQQHAIRPDFIGNILNAYGRVQPNLLKHDARYPSADTLRAKVKRGLPRYGMTGVGPGRDSEGSDWIIQRLDQPDDRPLWISIWGGPNTLAQALHTLRATRPAADVARLVAKLRVYTISDQDDSGAWLRREFPGLFYIVTPGDDYGQSTWIAINNTHEGIDNTTISNAWLAQHIQQGHGPLGAAYPDVAWGMEGDTPAYLGLIPNGLNVPDRPDWGGWGGRYELATPPFEKIRDGGSVVVPEPETRPIWTNASDTYLDALPAQRLQAGGETRREEFHRQPGHPLALARRLPARLRRADGLVHPPLRRGQSPTGAPAQSPGPPHGQGRGASHARCLRQQRSRWRQPQLSLVSLPRGGDVAGAGHLRWRRKRRPLHLHHPQGDPTGDVARDSAGDRQGHARPFALPARDRNRESLTRTF